MRIGRGQVRFKETIEVKQNVFITVRERGKIVGRRVGHNIWVNLGGEWLAALVSYITYSPLAAERDDRIRYMGVGIGGTRQLALSTANAAPLTPPYAGTNNQTDQDKSVIRLERAVRVSGGSTSYPGAGGDVWLGQVQAPPLHPVPSYAEFHRVFSESDVSYPPFNSVPLSEVGLFTNAADPAVYNNTLVGYDTFDTISKTPALALEIVWQLRFG